MDRIEQMAGRKPMVFCAEIYAIWATLAGFWFNNWCRLEWAMDNRYSFCSNCCIKNVFSTFQMEITSASTFIMKRFFAIKGLVENSSTTLKISIFRPSS